ncbi:hypothetical protein CDD80_734 [Ophiocordyceps camponoti-rufipedis]|uniref:Uncharacterized protein n=1 Tax=Ophiocordyceps camponoti-rufipedis TaxID=2004952 RepID=A0A2C5ZD17_9HYPO|nr:hypothetical protein CDD80_734 [Ophiocordyceps camponoti-rufipedis]
MSTMTVAAFQNPGTLQPHPTLRRHKHLPRPRNDRKLDNIHSVSTTHAAIDPAESQSPSPHVLKHEPRRIGPGPDPPPTPPNLSGNSSASDSASALPLGPSAQGTSSIMMHAGRRSLATPPDQRSLPTPDVTPPGPTTRSRALRSSVLERGSSKLTAADSLTASFKTAREVPSFSDDDSALRRGSPAAARPRGPRLQPRELLDLALNQAQFPQEDGIVSDVRRPAAGLDAEAPLPIQIRHQGYYDTESSPRHTSNRNRGPQAPAGSTTSQHAEPRRLMGHSVKPGLSAVVGAILVDLPPQRKRTLRHVQKRGTLREPEPASLANETARPTRAIDSVVPIHPGQRLTGHVVASGKERRQDWKDGGVPVTVIPDRRLSDKPRPNGEPSRRSTSSRPSRQTTSSECDSTGESRRGKKPTLRSRHAQALSSPRMDDGPLNIPALCSSTSASTTPDETAERSLERFLQRPEDGTTAGSLSPRPMFLPEMNMPSPTLIHFEQNESQDLLNFGRHDDIFKKYPSRNTPFSVASFETAAEVSEAMAVHMYPHQNSSLLVVDHLVKSLETADPTSVEAEQVLAVPEIRTTCPNGAPVTPPRQTSDEADSPLRNPRTPPAPPKQPPAIKLIPATPSGYTPADEKLAKQGNYFEATGEALPFRRPSLVKRALGRRRNTIDCPPAGAPKPLGLLARTLSLSRNARQPLSAAAATAYEPDAVPVSAHEGATPPEADKLHPFWHPHPAGSTIDGRGHRPQADDWPKRTLSARMKRTFAVLPPRSDDIRSAPTARSPERRTIRRSPSGSLRVMRRQSSDRSLIQRESWQGQPRPAPAPTLRNPWWSRRSKQRRHQPASRLARMSALPRILQERRRAKRAQELRKMISGPKDVRDGVREVIEPKGVRKQRLSQVEALDVV